MIDLLNWGELRNQSQCSVKFSSHTEADSKHVLLFWFIPKNRFYVTISLRRMRTSLFGRKFGKQKLSNNIKNIYL